MNRLTSDKRAGVINCLIEGCSIRATVRMTGVAKKTVMRLLVEVGQICADYQSKVFRNLNLRRIQVDELWAWCYCKQKNVTPEIFERNPDAGDVWLWVAIDAETKLVPCWILGQRGLPTAKAFIADLASRLANRVQLTTDGHPPYREAIETILVPCLSRRFSVTRRSRNHLQRKPATLPLVVSVLICESSPDSQRNST